MNSRIIAAITCWFVLINSAAASERQPIEIRVEVAEVDQAKASRLGIRWNETVTAMENEPAGVVSLGSFSRLTHIKAELDLLMEEGAAEILANPNLVTDSGTTATFHAGGQIPYVTTSSLGASNVEFKPYGVVLSVQPKLEKTGQIRLQIRAAVSSPDPTNGVMLSGTAVPALLERDISSHVTLESGQTMTLAGLVQTHQDTLVRGVPILRRIPLLGALFRWKKKNFRKTSIVVFVTPRVMDL